MLYDMTADKQMQVDHKSHANFETFDIEEQQDGDKIITSNYQPVDNKFKDEQQQYSESKQKKKSHHKKKKKAVTIDADVGKEPTISMINDNRMGDQQDVVLEDVVAQNSQTVIMLNDEKKKHQQKTKKKDKEEINDQEQTTVVMANVNSMIKNKRMVDTAIIEQHQLHTNTMNDIEADLGPIVGYAAEPLLSLAEACAPLIDIIHDLMIYVQMALDETPAEPPDELTIDESAAIRLYTIEWTGEHRSLYSMLNRTLKKDNREHLRPYFKYMKLFLTALVKLPCLPPSTVWRGVTKNMSSDFPPGTPVTWWAFSSCTTELTVLENNMYLGNSGSRTLFSVEGINVRTIRAHSHFVTEDEVLLLPGTHVIVRSLFSPTPDLHIIHLKQVEPEEVLLEPPFEGALLYPKIERSWYRQKKFAIPLCLLIVLVIAAIILGSILGTKTNIKPPTSICYTPYGPREIFKTGNSPVSVVLGDFDNDIYLDLIVVNQQDNNLAVLIGNGKGTFQAPSIYATRTFPTSVISRDLNNDRKFDLIVTNQNDNTISILLGYGDGIFITQTTYAAGSQPAAITSGDFNNDGNTDLVVANKGGNPVTILLNTKCGTIQSLISISYGYNDNTTSSSVTAGYFDSDHNLDLAVANQYTNTISVLLGYGNGTFASRTTFIVGWSPVCVISGDVNNDTKLDLVVVDTLSGDLSVLLNQCRVLNS